MRKILLTKEQEAYLRAHYPTDAQCDIAEHLHVSPPTIHRLASELCLKKSADWDASRYNNRIVKNYRHGRYSSLVK